jgi:hypothetical protein
VDLNIIVPVAATVIVICVGVLVICVAVTRRKQPQMTPGWGFWRRRCDQDWTNLRHLGQK